MGKEENLDKAWINHVVPFEKGESEAKCHEASLIWSLRCVCVYVYVGIYQYYTLMSLFYDNKSISPKHGGNVFI